MSKEAYYFPHDSNATNDPKIMLLIAEWGLEGYGIFWLLIEHLRNQPQLKAPLSILKPLALRYNSSEEKFRTIVERYDLFKVDKKENFFSLSLIRRMKPLKEKREHMRQLAIKRWESERNKHAYALRPHSEGNASKVKESKVKKSKEEYNNIPFNSDKFLKVWGEWEKHRSEIKKKITSTAKQKQFKKLSNYSETEAIEMLEQSIENGWQGIFEVKKKKIQQWTPVGN